MGKHTQNIDNKIRNRIYGHGKGWVFTPAHFSDLGSRDAVASALKRYRQSGLIRQLARGFYDRKRDRQIILYKRPRLSFDRDLSTVRLSWGGNSFLHDLIIDGESGKEPFTKISFRCIQNTEYYVMFHTHIKKCMDNGLPLPPVDGMFRNKKDVDVRCRIAVSSRL